MAILTVNLDRFIDFYASVFEAEVVFKDTGPVRHAILRVGPSSWLHPVEAANSPHATAIPAMLERGHLDHIALTAASTAAFEILRDRLVKRGASNGVVDDLGPFHTVWFEDPDGMRGEVTLVADSSLKGIHEPRPLLT